MAFNIYFYLILSFIICARISKSTELIESEENNEDSIFGSTTSATQDLYVIHAVKYDVGLLIESNDTEEINTEKTQNVQLTFYNANKNDTTVDLGQIPLPVQANVSGQVITGISPVNLGSIDLASLNNPGNGTNSSAVDASVGLLPNLQSLLNQPNITQIPSNAPTTQIGIPPLLSFGINSTLTKAPLPVLSFSNLNVSTNPIHV